MIKDNNNLYRLSICKGLCDSPVCHMCSGDVHGSGTLLRCLAVTLSAIPWDRLANVH